MRNILIISIASALTGCASASVAQKLNFVAFDEKASTENVRSIGSIEGKDCTWSVLGYDIGTPPNPRNAFFNAANQREQSLIPGKEAASKGSPLKIVKNVSVERGGFSAWVVGRQCMTVTGTGFL